MSDPFLVHQPSQYLEQSAAKTKSKGGRPPQDISHLPPTEQAKKLDQRERNRLASQKQRDKKKAMQSAAQQGVMGTNPPHNSPLVPPPPAYPTWVPFAVPEDPPNNVSIWQGPPGPDFWAPDIPSSSDPLSYPINIELEAIAYPNNQEPLWLNTPATTQIPHEMVRSYVDERHWVSQQQQNSSRTSSWTSGQF
ncbi:hypothetical protein BDV95DRAFT_605288 [Massariosphaeria phaeospora]|uniref:BZIP domain-containing protein n=1 Tax=Massariosphaeria phaeospora TaxID=100035 RepID=A0A7C8ICQ5_9PLEO|nr:hypothetical protein BDV95DRAFT_605288 [Massariosphaeria phaeospora]